MTPTEELLQRLTTLFEPVVCDHIGAAAPWACENCMNTGVIHDPHGDAAVEAAAVIREQQATIERYERLVPVLQEMRAAALRLADDVEVALLQPEGGSK